MAKATKPKADSLTQDEELIEQKPEVEATDKAEVVVIQGPPPTVITPPSVNYKGRTIKEKLLSYLEYKGGAASLNEFFKVEYGPLAKSPEQSKAMKVAIIDLVNSGLISVEGDYNTLGRFYYQKGVAQTQYQTMATVKLYATLIK